MESEIEGRKESVRDWLAGTPKGLGGGQGWQPHRWPPPTIFIFRFKLIKKINILK
jgi:hypothetical protein